MKTSNFKRREKGGEIKSSAPNETSTCEPAVPVWVMHTPTPGNMTDDSKDDTDYMCHMASPPSRVKNENDDKKGSMTWLKSLIPQSWSGVLHKWTKQSDSETSINGIQILPNGTRVSPPVSPFLERRNWDESLGNSSENSHKPLLKQSLSDHATCPSLREESLLTGMHPAEYYAEKMEVYKQKYSYLKSWPGLLRLLAGLQLLFGAMVFACVIAYIQKDSEWSSSYGLPNGIYNNGLGLSGYSYRGPMTPLTLAIAGVSWIITLCLLVIGMTMYYRIILLDSPWWPLTEAFINLALFLLYMAAGIVYQNDLSRGGLCYMTVGVNPITANLCRVDGGQMAGIAFIFINMMMYLGSFLVCLKMWRHETARKEREYLDKRLRGECQPSIPRTPRKTKHISFLDKTDKSVNIDNQHQDALPPDVHKSPLSRAAALNSEPKEHATADYIIKYPDISSVEEREKYKAVFNDQYQTYKDLHSDIITTLKKFAELDAVMEQLPRNGKSLEDQQRIRSILKMYHQKKNEPAFLEKKQRCDYLKAKLRHIKNKIHAFDQGTTAGGAT
ncbi:MARVEL domain-containing protein 2-like [Xenentodon cancila]